MNATTLVSRHRVFRWLLLAAIASAGYLTTAGIVDSAGARVDPQDHRYWFDPATQKLDADRMPARMRISVPWIKDWVWIDPLVVMPTSESPTGDGPFEVFDSEFGGTVVAEYYRSVGPVRVGEKATDRANSNQTPTADTPSEVP